MRKTNKMRILESMLYDYADRNWKRKEINLKVIEVLEKKNSLEERIMVSKTDGMPHSTEIFDPVYIAVQKIVDEYSRQVYYLKDELKKIDELEQKVVSALKCLNEWERKIIDLRYFHGKTWVAISMEVPYYVSHCKLIRNKALQKMQTI